MKAPGTEYDEPNLLYMSSKRGRGGRSSSDQSQKDDPIKCCRCSEQRNYSSRGLEVHTKDIGFVLS